LVDHVLLIKERSGAFGQSEPHERGVTKIRVGASIRPERCHQEKEDRGTPDGIKDPQGQKPKPQKARLPTRNSWYRTNRNFWIKTRMESKS
jgi:hypothetical protein